MLNGYSFIFYSFFKNSTKKYTHYSYHTAEADDLQHARTLVEILVDQENPELKDMKLSVAMYLKNVYRVISAVGHN
jgi:hypothetical protein